MAIYGHKFDIKHETYIFSLLNKMKGTFILSQKYANIV